MYSPLQFSLQSVRCKAHISKLWRGTESRQCLANVLPHQTEGCYIGAGSKTTCAAKRNETEEFTIAFAKLAEGKVDILQIRGGDGDESHPTTFNSTSTPVTLAVAEAVKKSGAKIVVAPIGGFEDPDLAEQWLAEGKMDLMAAGRAFVCEPDYVKKLYEDRGEDIVPCIPRQRRPPILRQRTGVLYCRRLCGGRRRLRAEGPAQRLRDCHADLSGETSILQRYRNSCCKRKFPL